MGWERWALEGRKQGAGPRTARRAQACAVDDCGYSNVGCHSWQYVEVGRNKPFAQFRCAGSIHGRRLFVLLPELRKRLVPAYFLKAAIAALISACIIAASFTPGELSTPLAVSTAVGSTAAIASATFPA